MDGKHLLRTLTWGVTTLLVSHWVQYLALNSTLELRYDQLFTLTVTFIFELTVPLFTQLCFWCRAFGLG